MEDAPSLRYHESFQPGPRSGPANPPRGQPDRDAAHVRGCRVRRSTILGHLIAGIALIGSPGIASAAEPGLPAAAAEKIDFEARVQPILQARCLSCHSRGKYKGGLSLETREALLRGGEEGPAAVVGKSAESLLVRLAAGLEEDRRMPQKGPALTPAQIGLLRAWIDQGMRWPEGLSFGFRRALFLNITRGPKWSHLST